MTKPNPCPEWKPEERLAVIDWIAGEMRSESEQSGHYLYGARHWADRLQLVAAMDTAYLELRRAYILQDRDNPLLLIENWSLVSQSQLGPYDSRRGGFVVDATNYNSTIRGITGGERYRFDLFWKPSSTGRTVSGYDRTVVLGDADPEYRKWRAEQGEPIDENNPVRVAECTAETIAQDFFRAYVRSGEPLPAMINRQASVRLLDLTLWMTRHQGNFALAIFPNNQGGEPASYRKKIADDAVMQPQEGLEQLRDWLADYVGKPSK